MAEKELPAPLARLERDYDTSGGRGPAWLVNWRWRASLRDAHEDRLSPEALSLLDLSNAFVAKVTDHTGTRLCAYRRFAAHFAALSDEAIRLWEEALSSEFMQHGQGAGRDARPFFRTLTDRTCAFKTYLDDSMVWVQDHTALLENLIRLARIEGIDTATLLDDSRALNLLDPEYSLWNRVLSPQELHEAAGVIQLHRAWMVHDEAERKRIKRFVIVHADEIGLAVQIVKSRYVHTLDQLDDLMGQYAAPALSEGAL